MAVMGREGAGARERDKQGMAFESGWKTGPDCSIQWPLSSGNMSRKVNTCMCRQERREVLFFLEDERKAYHTELCAYVCVCMYACCVCTYMCVPGYVWACMHVCACGPRYKVKPASRAGRGCVHEERGTGREQGREERWESGARSSRWAAEDVAKEAIIAS